MNPERTETFSVTVEPDATLLDGEDKLYEALAELQDARRSGDLHDLLDAQLAIMRAYCIIDDEIKETGELDEPRCPHCGSTYIDSTGDTYIHQLVEVQPDYPLDDATLKPGLVCINGEQRVMNGYMDNESPGYL